MAIAMVVPFAGEGVVVMAGFEGRRTGTHINFATSRHAFLGRLPLVSRPA